MNVASFLFVVAFGFVHASPDEVKLKSGRVMTNLKLESETATELRFVDHDGKKVVLPKDNVVEHVKKPTLREELEHRRSLVTKPSADEWIRLARWASEQEGLLDAEAKALYKEALALDPENARARDALGYVKKDGKWFSAEEAAEAEAKAYVERAKLAGGKKVKGEWKLPSDLSKAEGKLVEHLGRFVSPELKKKIEDKKLVYAEGEWLTPEEKAWFDEGKRKGPDGKWAPIATLDPIRAKPATPWTLKGRWIEVKSTAPYERAAFALKTADETAGLVVEWAGVEPDVYGKAGPLLVLFGATIDDYKKMGANSGSDWSSVRSSSDGCFYTPKLPQERERGAAITYDCQIDRGEYARYFLRRCAAEAFIARFTDPSKIEPQLLDAYAAYFAGFHGRRRAYAPNWWPFSMYMKDKPVKSALDVLKGARRDERGVDPTLWQAGFFIHYLTTLNEAAVKEHFLKLLSGKATIADLHKAVFEDQKPEAIAKAFDAFMDEYRKNFRHTEP
jgi:hypothetical protein